MVTPAGDPAWTRTAGADTYGGISTLRNLGDIGAVNAKTDVTAEEYLRISSDLARCVQTAPLFWMRMTLEFDSGAFLSAAVTQCCAQWSGPSGSYDGATPPSTSWPTVASGGSAAVIVSFPGLVSGSALSAADDYGVAGAFSLSAASASGASGDLPATITPTSITISSIPDGALEYTLVVY